MAEEARRLAWIIVRPAGIVWLVTATWMQPDNVGNPQERSTFKGVERAKELEIVDGNVRSICCRGREGGCHNQGAGI